MPRQITRDEWLRQFGATHGVGKHRMAGQMIAPAAPPTSLIPADPRAAYLAVSYSADGQMIPFDGFRTEDQAWQALHSPSYGALIPQHEQIDVLPREQAMALFEQQERENMLRRHIESNPWNV